MTHEPGAGVLRADAYFQRLNGIGLVWRDLLAVGGLNVLNANRPGRTPEKIAGGRRLRRAPGVKDREKDPLLHHKVKNLRDAEARSTTR